MLEEKNNHTLQTPNTCSQNLKEVCESWSPSPPYELPLATPGAASTRCALFILSVEP